MLVLSATLQARSWQTVPSQARSPASARQNGEAMAIDEEITLKKLEVFLTFMRLNNLARVSEVLGQSTVSVHRALHSLEEGMRCLLFKREGRNLIPLHTAYT